MTTSWLVNGNIVLEDRVLQNGYVGFINGVISSIGEGSPQRADAADSFEDVKGQWIVPGFIDVHVHGGGGHGFMDPSLDDIASVAKFHAKHGTTAMLATTSTAPIDLLTAAIERLSTFIRSSQYKGSRVIGMHVEGPFISHKRKGAQDAENIILPDAALAREWLQIADGLIRLMTIAPEVPGAIELIRELRQKGVTIGAGHTDATYEQALEGVRSGVTHSIHTYNGMRPIHHRDPGVLSALLSEKRITCELIADGHHVHPGAIRLLYAAKGPRGIVLITDAVQVAGLPDGVYTSERSSVRLNGGIVELADGSSLAGSILTMDQAYRNVLSYLPINMVEASIMASTTPATSIGVAHRKGSIALGLDADFVVLNKDLCVVRTIVEGTCVYDASVE